MKNAINKKWNACIWLSFKPFTHDVRFVSIDDTSDTLENLILRVYWYVKIHKIKVTHDSRWYSSCWPFGDHDGINIEASHDFSSENHQAAVRGLLLFVVFVLFECGFCSITCTQNNITSS